jgi:hypothetical protein
MSQDILQNTYDPRYGATLSLSFRVWGRSYLPRTLMRKPDIHHSDDRRLRAFGKTEQDEMSRGEKPGEEKRCTLLRAVEVV